MTFIRPDGANKIRSKAPFSYPIVLDGNVSIRSDGTAAGTRVYNSDGKEMSNVVGVEWRIDMVTQTSTVILKMVHVKLEAVGKTVSTVMTKK